MCFDKYDHNQDGYLDYPDVLELVQHSYTKKGNKENALFYQDAATKLIENVARKEPGRITR